jgi:hypothetical protein
LLGELTTCRQRAETLELEVGALLDDLGRWSERATAALAEIDAASPPHTAAPPSDAPNGDVSPSGDGSGATAGEEPAADGEAESDASDTSWWETDLAATMAALDDADTESAGVTTVSSESAGEAWSDAADDGATDQTGPFLGDGEQTGERGLDGGTQGFSLVVHGARPTAALSLRSYLTSLDHVTGVVVRDYAADELHAQLSVTRPLRIDDFQGWHGNTAITVVSEGEDALELQLGAVGGD